MTIIFQKGNEFWIESIELSLSVPDVLGRTDSAVVNLERSGFFLGVAEGRVQAGNNDNTQAIGWTDIRDQGGAKLDIGDRVTGILMRVTKQAGTAGPTLITSNVLIFLRGHT